MAAGRVAAVAVATLLYVVTECLVSAHSKCAPEPCEVRLRIDAGWLCGRARPAEDGTPYASFRGVPYAKPPLGERRFKELEPPDPWDHLYDATEDSAVCPQKDFIYSRMPLQLKGMSEDCIYLNLHMPMSALPATNGSHHGTKVLPILVMVHGGGFQAGSALTDMHGPEYLLRNDVIVITFNMRINIFGFLSLNTAKIPGNQGLRDIISALRWVHRNALAFGGNPDDVTLMGHSSGAICAHLVSLSKPAKGLIHKVILMSGTGVPNGFSTSQAHAKSVADNFIATVGINSTDPDYIHDRLTKEPLLNLMNALNIVQSKADVVLLNFVPVIESEFPNVTRVLDDDPLALIAKGRSQDYPFVVGFTTKEFNYFRWQLLSTDIVNRINDDATIMLASRLRNNYPPEEKQRLANEVKRHYFNGRPTFERAIDNYSDMMFRHPAMLVAEWKAIRGAPVYLYQFSYESERNIVQEGLWSKYSGVAHVEDLTYVFRINSLLQGYKSYPPKNKDDLMKEWLPTLFVNFARCGNPTCTPDQSQWPPLTPEWYQYQDIAEPKVFRMSNLTEEQREMMQFYDQLDEELRGVGEQLRKNSGNN